MPRVMAAIAVVCFSVVASLTAFGGSARADEPYPSKPIRLILPQPAGGAVDLIARSLADRLSESTRQPVIVENQPGANGGLAAGQVMRSTPDGYTLFMAVDTNLVVNPSLYPNLTYDPFRDFIPISIIGWSRAQRSKPTACENCWRLPEPIPPSSTTPRSASERRRISANYSR